MRNNIHHCISPVLCCTVCAVQCALYSEQCIVSSVHCAVCSMQSIVHTVVCSYAVKCLVHTALHSAYHSWFVRTLRTKKTKRTLRTKKPKAHFYFPEIKYKVTIHILVKFSVLRIKM